MYDPLDASKTQEILSRFRPIAPKPHLPPNHQPPPHPALHLRSRRPRFRSKRQKPLPFPTPSPPVERDLLQNLNQPPIIAPRPVRPIGSSISVGLINQLAPQSSPPPPPKRPEEIEYDVESETLPAVVSDCKNRVWLANSAYKELVGQPECMWLDSLKGFDVRPLSRRINGEVMIRFAGDSARPLLLLNGFSCRAKIEWACDGRRSFVDAPCDVIRVCCCDSKEYLFTWKFRVGEACRTDCV